MEIVKALEYSEGNTISCAHDKTSMILSFYIHKYYTDFYYQMCVEYL